MGRAAEAVAAGDVGIGSGMSIAICYGALGNAAHAVVGVAYG